MNKNITKERLEELNEKGYSIYDMADELGVLEPKTIQNALKRFGIIKKKKPIIRHYNSVKIHKTNANKNYIRKTTNLLVLERTN